MILNKVEKVERTILRGCQSYKEFLILLKNEKAPLEHDAFIDFMANQFYVSDDFFAIMALVQCNLGCYEENSSNEVIVHIFEEIFNDYLKQLG